MSKKVEVILLKDLKSKGKMGEIISVLEGYARNYLFPNGIAKIANEQAIKEMEAQKKAEAIREENQKKEAENIASMINEQSIDIYMNSGENGKLFGSVTSKNISDALYEKFAISIDSHNIRYLSEEEEEKSINTLGIHPCEIKLYQGVTAKINVNVCESREKTNKS